MVNSILHVRSNGLSPPAIHVSVPAAAATLASFVLISFWLCMLLGLVAPDWGLHRPWLQFYLGLSGFDLRSLALGTVQSIAFGLYAGAAIALLFNVFSRRLG
ncbi:MULTISPECIES: hypothetical protein [Chelatococcus]|uniref:Uncharacterized protein n=1 Tax=Chelatococcus caeni TaxID=1348468 RepID=A0A840BV18_9HYPH|nr:MULTISPECIES: hypothetical protein [Chelatococcus]ALA19119.1 hypothetical protein AL346_19040 [Chelatococcus sp. CO-6]MBB4016403.1 hypothetical protein [Chelatococcus caeni]